MLWQPVPPLEIFAEALSVPVVIHTPVRPTRVLIIGPYGVPAAKLALRYPSTAEVVLVSSDEISLRDKRFRRISSIKELPADWKADAAVVAVVGDPRPLLPLVKERLVPDGLVVVALDRFGRGRDTKDALRALWGQVLPYREYVPDPHLFLLAGDRRIGKPLRPIPPNLKRITDRYLQSLFTLGKDEYQFLYGDRAA